MQCLHLGGNTGDVLQVLLNSLTLLWRNTVSDWETIIANWYTTEIQVVFTLSLLLRAHLHY
jgi:hypothetical protein